MLSVVFSNHYCDPYRAHIYIWNVLEEGHLVGGDPGIKKLRHTSTSTGTHSLRSPLLCSFISVHLEAGGAGRAGEGDLEH